MPYFDVKPDNPHFRAIQRIGATGLLRGVGEAHLWANRTWFYPDSTVSSNDFFTNYFNFNDQPSGSRLAIDKALTVDDVVELLHVLIKKEEDKKLFRRKIEEQWETLNLKNFDINRPITRLELAAILDKTWNPFDREVGFDGQLRK
jgi:hypothetical protein